MIYKCLYRTYLHLRSICLAFEVQVFLLHHALLQVNRISGSGHVYLIFTTGMLGWRWILRWSSLLRRVDLFGNPRNCKHALKMLLSVLELTVLPVLRLIPLIWPCWRHCMSHVQPEAVSEIIEFPFFEMYLSFVSGMKVSFTGDWIITMVDKLCYVMKSFAFWVAFTNWSNDKWIVNQRRNSILKGMNAWWGSVSLGSVGWKTMGYPL
jgi:hypothetical protein